MPHVVKSCRFDKVPQPHENASAAVFTQWACHRLAGVGSSVTNGRPFDAPEAFVRNRRSAPPRVALSLGLRPEHGDAGGSAVRPIAPVGSPPTMTVRACPIQAVTVENCMAQASRRLQGSIRAPVRGAPNPYAFGGSRSHSQTYKINTGRRPVCWATTRRLNFARIGSAPRLYNGPVMRLGVVPWRRRER